MLMPSLLLLCLSSFAGSSMCSGECSSSASAQASPALRDSDRDSDSELADFLWAAAGEYGFNPDNVYAVGFSNGANAATSLLLLQPDSVAGVVALGNNKVFDETPFKRGKPDLTGKRVWIANGAADAYSPQVRVDALIEELKSLGAAVTFKLHPGGHTISKDHIQQIHSELT